MLHLLLHHPLIESLPTLEHDGLLLNKRVLINGASGGVGHLACQLAHHAGAWVVGVVRQPGREAGVRAAGAHEVVVSEDLSEAHAFGPYDLILESVGGRALGNAIGMLAPEGVCVNFGSSSAGEVTFDARRFFLTGGASIYGFIIFHEVTRKSAAEGLTRLSRLVADGRLRPQIEVEAPWTQVGEAAQQLMDRSFAGKAVLHVGS